MKSKKINNNKKNNNIRKKDSVDLSVEELLRLGEETNNIKLAKPLFERKINPK